MDDDRKARFFGQVSQEPFPKLLDIKLVDVADGYALCEMYYTEAMDNLHGMAHGGAIFSLIDEAFEISSNSHGTVAVALNMNISYVKAARKGSLLRAESKETNKGRKTATYYITVSDDEGLVAICQALVYRKGQTLPFLQE